MSARSVVKRFRPGMPALTSILLLVGALAGLYVADTQIQVFGFGNQWPDARTVPMAVLGLLAVATALRIVLNLNSVELPVGPARSHGRVALVVLSSAAALWSMTYFGFLPGAVFVAFVSTLALGERRPVFVIGLPLVVAFAVYYGGRYGLNVPLP